MLDDASILTALSGVPPVGTPDAAARLSRRRFRRHAGRIEAVPLDVTEESGLTAFEVMHQLRDAPDRLAQLARTGVCEARNSQALGAVEAAQNDLVKAGLSAKRGRALDRERSTGNLEGAALASGLPWPIASGGVAYRLRTLRDVRERAFKSGDVARLAEAAGLVARQQTLSRALGLGAGLPSDLRRPEAVWGTEPAFKHGYELARKTRYALKLTADQPITSLRALVEDHLGIPIIQTRLTADIAGATVEVDGQRGIALNTQGGNENVWVRRVTLAHELCHLLWDESSALRSLHVDRYDALESGHRAIDPYEQRANAFAIAFLAPLAATVAHFDAVGGEQTGVRSVMEHFGIGRSAALHHLANAGRQLSTRNVQIEAESTDDWRAAENHTIDVLGAEPLDGSGGIDEPRSGRFAALVARALDEGLLSPGTAAAWLGVQPAHLDSSWRALMAELFPDLSAEVARSRVLAAAHARRARFDENRRVLASVAAAHPNEWIALIAGVTIAHDPSYQTVLEHTRRLGYDPASLLCINPSQQFVPV